MMDHLSSVAFLRAKVKAKNPAFGWIFSTFVLLSLLCTTARGQQTPPTKIACVGDSITEGNANPEHLINSWPRVLGRLLEAEFPGSYQTGNFGRSGATLLRKGSYPYWDQDVYTQSLEFLPQIVLINLGTNDAVNRNWLEHGEDFEKDYRELIEMYRQLESKPKILLSNLTPMYAAHPRTQECIPHRLIIEKTIGELAKEFGLSVIDFKSPFSDHVKLFPDGLHPNTLGNELMAMAAFEAITGQTAPKDPSIRPTSVEGDLQALILEGMVVGFPSGSWKRQNDWVEGTGAGKELLSKIRIEEGDFHLRAKLRMVGQKNSAAGFMVNGNFFGFEGASGTIFRNGPQMGGGLRLLHQAGLLWKREAWIDFEVIRNQGMVWFLVDDFVVEMAFIPGPIAKFGFAPMRSLMQISDCTLVGETSVIRPAHMNARTVQTPWIDFSKRPETASYLGGTGVGETPKSGVNPQNQAAAPIPSPDGTQQLRIQSQQSGQKNSFAEISDDGGKTWSSSFDLPASLSGQGHIGTYLANGLLLIGFMDTHESSPTRGDYVAWVGTFEDIVQQKEGRFTCKLVDAGQVPDGLGSIHWKGALDDLYALMKEVLPTPGFEIPIVDLDSDPGRHVLVDREKGQYLGHVTTELLDDGKTILAVYPKGHGRGPIVYKRSEDGGLTWSDRLPTPESWSTSKEVPTLHQVIDPKTGKKRLIVWSGLYPARLAVSEDDGDNWSELKKVGDWGGIVVMGFVKRLKSGSYLAMFHDDGRFFTSGGKRPNPPGFTLYQTLSHDGGLTWSQPDVVWSGNDIHLCEPGCVRSPDGNTLAVLLRENSRTRNSFIIFSEDEGKSWSVPRELPASLTGDRHTAHYAPDGRLLITFRDTAHQSPTQGDWVAWVGTWEDLLFSKPGQYRVRIKDNKHRWDTTYPGLELLPDGTFVVTTYGHWDEGEHPYILSARFTLDELDQKAKRLPTKTTLFDRGQKGVHTYRIPALITTKQGTLIACCDARHNSARDLPSNIDTVIRRSTDGGKSWSDITTIVENSGTEGAADPCMVVDQQTGRIWCAVTWADGVGWYNSKPGYGSDSFHNLLVYSDDDGLSWSDPMDITSSIKDSKWISVWFSPGVGLQTKSGRLIIPFSAAHTREQVFSYAAISDDHGKTWRRVGPMGSNTNECMIAGLADGTLICNMRSTAGLNRRAISISKDDGESWSKLVHHEDLVEPVCQASVLTVPAAMTPDGREWLLFCNPASTKREKLTLRASFDGGKTWPIARLIHAGPTAYSCMTLLPQNDDHKTTSEGHSISSGGVGLLYERGSTHSNEGISFASIPLSWILDGGKDE